MTTQHYIGFDSLDEMLRGIPTETPVYVSAAQTDKPYKSSAGMSERVFSLTVAVIGPQNAVRYAYMVVGKVTMLHGKVFEGQMDENLLQKRSDRTQSAKAIVTEWLQKQGYHQVLNGHLSFPTTHPMYQTQLDIIREDGEVIAEPDPVVIGRMPTTITYRPFTPPGATGTVRGFEVVEDGMNPSYLTWSTIAVHLPWLQETASRAKETGQPQRWEPVETAS